MIGRVEDLLEKMKYRKENEGWSQKYGELREGKTWTWRGRAEGLKSR